MIFYIYIIINIVIFISFVVGSATPMPKSINLSKFVDIVCRCNGHFQCFVDVRGSLKRTFLFDFFSFSFLSSISAPAHMLSSNQY